jgi:hypothetical protein
MTAPKTTSETQKKIDWAKSELRIVQSFQNAAKRSGKINALLRLDQKEARYRAYIEHLREAC